jgi:hypothetical protein
MVRLEVALELVVVDEDGAADLLVAVVGTLLLSRDTSLRAAAIEAGLLALVILVRRAHVTDGVGSQRKSSKGSTNTNRELYHFG